MRININELNNVPEELEKIVNEDGKYIVPVSWSVYSTVVVEGVSNLREAVAAVKNELDEIPLSHDPEYIDGSYKIDCEDADDYIVSQSYTTTGVLMEVDKNSDDASSFTIID